jgi:type IX secretion system substrate protein/fibronectin type III domain protein
MHTPDGDSLDNYLVRSFDHGATFGQPLRISTTSSDLTASWIGPDYMGVAAYSNSSSTVTRIVPAWSDLRDPSTANHSNVYIDRLAIVSSNLQSNWNMVSVPANVTSFYAYDIFLGSFETGGYLTDWPLSYSPSQGYQQEPVLATGVGYWLNSNRAVVVNYFGEENTTLKPDVSMGWNLIGALSSSIAASQVASDPPGIVTSNFFGFNTPYGSNYTAVSTLDPGYGYWVKVNSDGRLILSTTGSSGNNGGQCVVPPLPPGAPPTPSLYSPQNNSVDLPLSLTLSWNPSFGATSYEVQIATAASFSLGTRIFDQSTSSTSVQVSGLAYSTTYFWRVDAVNSNEPPTSSPYSCPWSFVTQAASQPPCDCCASSISMLDQFTIADATGGAQQLVTVNGGRTITLPFSDEDMPPVPPKGVFDARFQSGKFLQKMNLGSGLLSIPIKIKDAHFPLRLSWDLKPENNTRYWLRAPGKNGKNIGLSGRGTIDLVGADNGTLSLTAEPDRPAPCDPSKTAKGDGGEGVSIPEQYSLLQNYPNPFNPSTLVRYELSEGTQVILEIYDVLGREVKTLVNEFQGAGYKSVNFDAGSLPSGVYFYRLHAGKFTDVKKMLIAK